jgi:hypothetical protein
VSKSIWGNLPTPDAVKSPVVVLKEQADFLTQGSGGILKGQVTQNRNVRLLREMGGGLGGIGGGFVGMPGIPGMTKPNQKDTIEYSFDIHIQNIQYTYTIATISFDPVDLYPVTVKNLIEGNGKDVKNEEELLAFMGEIVQKPTGQAILAKLVRAAKSTQ